MLVGGGGGTNECFRKSFWSSTEWKRKKKCKATLITPELWQKSWTADRFSEFYLQMDQTPIPITILAAAPPCAGKSHQDGGPTAHLWLRRSKNKQILLDYRSFSLHRTAANSGGCGLAFTSDTISRTSHTQTSSGPKKEWVRFSSIQNISAFWGI